MKLPNIEYSYLKKRDSLINLIAVNPALNNIFTDGFVSSVSGGVTYSTVKNENQTVYSANFEESGLLTGLIPSRFLDSQLYRFIKVNVEYTRLMKMRSNPGYLFSDLNDPFNTCKKGQAR